MSDAAHEAVPHASGVGRVTGGRNRPSLSDSISAGILEMARQRGLRPGDPMPNARTLAEHFDVATPTVREALRSLEATGSIELRHGSGIYVGANLSRILLPNPHAGETSIGVLMDMLEARLMIEPNLAEMAAARALSDDEVGELERAVLVSERQEPAGRSSGMTFHRQLAMASGNFVLYEVVDSLLSVRWREQKMLRRMYDDRSRDRDQHREILDAVVTGDVDLARELSRQHLEEIRDVIDNSRTPQQS